MVFTSSDIIFVTGGNGHVAQHVIQQLLSHTSQPTIRTSVRSPASATKLRTAFPSPNLEVILISDITAPGAFSSALKNVTHLAHVASPLIIGAQDLENDLLIPAINGTTSILTSALTCSTLKSVVLTSSFASVFDPSHGWRPNYTYTPSDWNPITRPKITSHNFTLSSYPETWRPYVTYMASKTLAERAAWDLYHSSKPAWDFSVILPTYIGGPCILPVKREEDLSFSNGLIWKSVSGGDLPLMDYPYWVDVRDVAKAHVEALQRKEASGQRFILAVTGTTYSEIADIARKTFKELSPSKEVQKVEHWAIDTSNTEILGFEEWIPLEKTVVDLVSQVLDENKDTSS